MKPHAFPANTNKYKMKNTEKTKEQADTKTAVSSSLSIQDRIDIVNKIIEKISSLDRKFFQYNGIQWYVFYQHNKLFIRNSYNNKDINLSKSESRPTDFSQGGTLWGLTKDFRDFILTGNKSNGENGYGGLFSPHWGYLEESMKEIRNLAESLGYL